MRVIVTRARADAERTATALRVRGHEVLLSPVLEIVGTCALIDPGAAQAVIATSAHAFETLAPQILANIRTLPIFVVGSRTAKAALRIGLPAPRLTAARASDLASQMAPSLSSGSRLLYLAGRDRKPDLENALHGKGFAIDTAVVYEARALGTLSPEAASALARGEANAVLHFSRRSAQLFLDCAAKGNLSAEAARLRHICISQDAAADLGALAQVAQTPDSPGLFRALEQM